jgi:hypothetical protein
MVEADYWLSARPPEEGTANHWEFTRLLVQIENARMSVVARSWIFYLVGDAVDAADTDQRMG